MSCFRAGAVPEPDAALAYDQMRGPSQPDWLHSVMTRHDGKYISWDAWLAATGRPPIG